MLNRPYDTDLTDAAWELVKPLLPAARHGCRPRTTDVRAVVDAIFYLLRTGCQWRLLPQMEEIEKSLKEVMQTVAGADLLRTLPAIGPILSAVIALEIG